MINVKTALISITIALLLVGGFGFTAKPTDTITYYYRGPTASGASLLSENEVRNTANWSTTCQISYPINSLHSITFNQESGNESNGIGDGKYSLQEAINAVWFEYASSGRSEQGRCFTPAISGASVICIGKANSNQ